MDIRIFKGKYTGISLIHIRVTTYWKHNKPVETLYYCSTRERCSKYGQCFEEFYKELQASVKDAILIHQDKIKPKFYY